MHAPFQKNIWFIPVLYILFGFLWIFISDNLVFALITDSSQLLQWQLYKGWVFVFASTLVISLLVFFADRQQKKSRSALASSEDLYRLLFENNPLPMWVYDLETYAFLAVNEAAVEKYGYSRTEFLEMTLVDICPADDASRLLTDMEETTQQLNFAGEWRHLCQDGRLILVEIISHTLTYNGRAARLVVSHDITERKQAQQQIAFQAYLLNHVSDAIIAADLNSVITSWNIAAETIYGWSSDVALGKDIEELLDTRYTDGVRPEAARQVLAQTGSWQGFLNQKGKDGRRRHIFSNVTLLHDKEGNPTGSVAVNRDMTEQQQAKKLLHLRSAALEATANGVVITDVDGIIQWVNPAFETLTGFSRNEAVGRNPGDLLKSGQHDHTFYRQMWQTILAGEVWRGDIINRRKNGSLYIEEQMITPVRDEKDQITHFVGIKRDVTEDRQQARYQAAQARLATVGQLAAGIAHDFNNVLGVIMLYSQMVSHGPNLSPKQKKQLSVIMERTDHAAKLIEQILDFGRRSLMSRAPLNLLPLVKEMIKLLKNTLPENIHLALDYDQNAYTVNADPTRLQQVLMNLVLNARDAMPQGGKLHLSLTSLQFDDQQQLPLPDMDSGDWVTLRVADTGKGVDAEHIDHLFEPFFTTKVPGEGTGLGLAQVYGIVKQHDGFIEVHSEPERGATFTIYLPLVAEAEGQTNYVPETTTSPVGNETILVVEDSPILRQAIVDTLSALGYRLLVAADGQAALTVFAQDDVKINLLLTDLVMPQMGGLELYEAVKQYSPETKVLIMTGYAPMKTHKLYEQIGEEYWIDKPFDQKGLAKRIRVILDRA